MLIRRSELRLALTAGLMNGFGALAPLAYGFYAPLAVLVVCTGTSMPQLRAILRDVAGKVEEEHDAKPVHTEGRADTRWVVLDYIDVMVHVMDTELREFYGLENLWKDAREVEWRAAA